MKTKYDIIDAGLSSLETLINFIKKPIDFSNVANSRLKAVVDGRSTAFTIAVHTVDRIRQIESSLGCYDESVGKQRLEMLIVSTDTIFKEIEDVLKLDIDPDAEDDDKVKQIVESKRVAFDFLENIINVRDDINYKIKTDADSVESVTNFAVSRVKAKNNR